MGRFLPRIAEARTGRTNAAWHVLLTCCLFAAAPGGVFGQGADTNRTHWVPARSFNIPFGIPGNDPRIVEVLLHVSTDNQPYRYVAAARPSDRRFFFQAQGDGWYSFVVQTRDRDNLLTPANVNGAPPEIKVCVDTQRPVINVQAAQPQDGYPAAIQWTIQDANFEDVRADYRSVNGGEWYPLLLPRTASGRHDWTPAVAGDVEVRMQALDKAKNQAEPRSATVKPVATRPGAPLPNTGTPSDIRHVKNKTFQLDYQLDDSTVGPSDVKSVDIWRIRQGGPWQKCREAGPAKGPATVTVETTGRWGFRLIPRSGVGLAEPDPRPGDPPDLWVEVDDRAPQVHIVNVVVTPGADTGRMTVTWTASDPFLSRQPITISYSPNGQEDWRVIDKCENTGSFTCEPSKQNLPYQFYLRVQAVDEAGNVGEDKWREAVKVDLKVPRIKHIDVKPSDGQQQTQAPFAPQAQSPPVRPAVSPKPSATNNGFPGYQVP
jgi:hypothetical protein